VQAPGCRAGPHGAPITAGASSGIGSLAARLTSTVLKHAKNPRPRAAHRLAPGRRFSRYEGTIPTRRCPIAALEYPGVAPSARLGDDQPLFPPIEPYATGYLEVGAPHRLYWEQSGNPNGVPLVFLHGGPGAGTAPAYRRFFDPAHYRIVLFDQRGAGRSTPEADLTDNTTQHLIADIETLRAHLGIPRWMVFGGSWGSTLALAYGEAHPDRCIGFILRGIFLFSADEVSWFLGERPDGGMARFFPEAHRAFAHLIPQAERGDLLGAYYRRLTHPDPGVHKPAAAVWCAYENACSRLIPVTARAGRAERGDSYYNGALAMARIEAHYMMHGGFLRPRQLLDEIDVLADHPAVIIQGRYDMVCPIVAADALARAWPGAQYRIVPDAGHSSMEPGIRTALVRATEDFKLYR
jgi:proline iminopeptidase